MLYKFTRLKVLLLFPAIFFSQLCIAQQNILQQNKVIDSLRNILANLKEDTNKVNKLNDMSVQLRSLSQIADSKTYADSALALAEKLHFTRGIALAYHNIGNGLIVQGKYKEALKNYFASLRKKEEMGDKAGIAFCYNNIGAVYGSQGNYPEALKNFLASLAIKESIGDKKGIAVCYQNIGAIYFWQRNYGDALKNYMASLKIYEETGNKKGIAECYSLIGMVYKNLGNYPEALKNLQVAWKVGKQIEVGAYNPPYSDLGNVYYAMGNYSEAFKNYLASLKLLKEMGDEAGIAKCYIDIGNLNIKLNKPAEAKKYMDSGLALGLKVGHKESASAAYKGLAAVDSAMGNYRQSLEHYKFYLMYKDSLFNETTNRQIAEMKEQYDSERKDKEIVQLHSEKEKLESEKLITALQFKVQQESMNRIAALNLFNAQRIELLSKEKRLQQLELEKTQADYALQKTAGEKNLANFLAQKSETQNKENQLQLVSKEKEIQRLELNSQRMTKNYLLSGLFLFMVLSFFVYKNYHTRQKLKLQTLRNKIASDLHDDVGSTLSSISIFSQMAQQQSKEVIPLLDSIGESSRKMLDAMSDIVWTINPENDQFEKIILRMRSFAYELLGAKNIDFEFIADDEVENIKLPMNVRKNLYLIFKEATNNLVKYAAADKALFAIKGGKNDVTMLIQDNGKGFNINEAREGNGLKNMEMRAKEIGGKLQVDSMPGTGTTIQLRVAV